jgi:TetR/AcrR family transcriptional repressor of nem operon
MGNAGEKKRRTRYQILESAWRRFAAGGFDAASIEEIMRDCELTHGGFYAHFRSKGELYREAVGHAIANGWLWASMPALGGGSVEDLLRSPQLAFLAADVASAEPEVRDACRRALREISARVLGAGASEAAKLSLTAMIVGALAVARSSDDRVFRAKLVSSCEDVARLLGGGAAGPAGPAYFWEPQPTT